MNHADCTHYPDIPDNKCRYTLEQFLPIIVKLHPTLDNDERRPNRHSVLDKLKRQHKKGELDQRLFIPVGSSFLFDIKALDDLSWLPDPKTSKRKQPVQLEA